MLSTKKTTIIYAEDSKSISHLVKSKLISEGYEVTHFENGVGVVEAVKSSMPTLVILDKEMPLKDGMAVLEELKQIPETKDIPVIMFTTKKEQETVLRCIQLGVTDYIIKDSLAISNLLPRIRKYIK